MSIVDRLRGGHHGKNGNEDSPVIKFRKLPPADPARDLPHHFATHTVIDAIHKIYSDNQTFPGDAGAGTITKRDVYETHLSRIARRGGIKTDANGREIQVEGYYHKYPHTPHRLIDAVVASWTVALAQEDNKMIAGFGGLITRDLRRLTTYYSEHK